MNSPLILPVTLAIAGVLAFMATTGLLPATLFRLWPIVFVILGIVGLLSLSSEELEMSDSKPAKKKSSAKKTTASAKKTAPAKKVSKAAAKTKATKSAKTSKTSARKTAKKK